MASSSSIDIVRVESLHERLGYPVALDYPAASRIRPLADWKMEVDDAPILRYIYRHSRPVRHLEFGTWEGTGACFCLEESDAAVWTINLPGGEMTDGRPAYASSATVPPPGAVPVEGTTYQTDAGIFIGHRYRAAGFGHRVCQIYCDSRQWDTSAYPEGFFDTALIDGGHAEDVVISDTRKALPLVRRGGIVLWHDFCPDPSVFAAQPAAIGVVGALTRGWDEVSASLTDAFWIEPSFILVGVR
jgi:predicted O-methyltransferase YrrM